MSDKLRDEIEKDWMELDKKYEAMGEKEAQLFITYSLDNLFKSMVLSFPEKQSLLVLQSIILSAIKLKIDADNSVDSSDDVN
tara:strand:- start:463 stop:708 length:246 start_codon:yes stop_codon:yes gene_type:complete